MKFKLIENINSQLSNLYKIPKYLYHATYGLYLDNIKRDGYIKGGLHDNYGFSNKVICLSPDIDGAGCFAEAADNVSDEVYDSGIFVLKVDTDKLDKNMFQPDRNTTPWEENGKWYGITFEYLKDIPVSAIVDIVKY